MTHKINKLTIIGVGLMGGSLAQALKKQNYVKEIVGFSRDENKLKIAKNMGAIDSYSNNLLQAVQGADVIVIATPVASFEALLTQINPVLSKQTLITDVGSVKGSVMALAQQVLGNKAHQFIGGHPIAGVEKSGVEASVNNLFESKKVILTPKKDNTASAITTIKNMWQAVGAVVVEMSAQQHDDILSSTSHLPHILAFGLMDYLSNQTDDVYQYAAGGFKDFSRIASSDATMWRDICLNNKTAILKDIKAYQLNLDKISKLIEFNDSQSLFELFQKSKKDRDNYLISLHK